MRRTRVSASVAVVIGLALGTGGVASADAPRSVADAASGSVLAVSSSSGLRTAFVFGDPPWIVGSSATGAGRLIDTHGDTFAFAASQTGAGLFAARAPNGVGQPVPASTIRNIRGTTPAYAIGPPLGYGAERIRSVRLAHVRPPGVRSQSVGGRLPQAFLGAPIVAPSGEVLGAVGAVGPKNWTFVPVGRLRALIAHAASGSSGGFPVLVVFACAFLLIVAFATVRVLMSKRRRHAVLLATGSGPSTAQTSPAHSEPLIRRLTNEPDDPAEEDFDVIVKSQEGGDEPS